MEYDQNDHPNMGEGFCQPPQVISQKNHPSSLFMDKTKMEKTQKSPKQTGPKKRSSRVSSAYLGSNLERGKPICRPCHWML
jgi:hypothetical protein